MIKHESVEEREPLSRIQAIVASVFEALRKQMADEEAEDAILKALALGSAEAMYKVIGGGEKE